MKIIYPSLLTSLLLEMHMQLELYPRNWCHIPVVPHSRGWCCIFSACDASLQAMLHFCSQCCFCSWGCISDCCISDCISDCRNAALPVEMHHGLKRCNTSFRDAATAVEMQHQLQRCSTSFMKQSTSFTDAGPAAENQIQPQPQG